MCHVWQEWWISWTLLKRKGVNEIPVTGLTQTYFCACPKSEPKPISCWSSSSLLRYLGFDKWVGYLFVFHFITFCSDGEVFICFSFNYILLWWRGIYLFFILLDFSDGGYFFFLHYIRFFWWRGIYLFFILLHFALMLGYLFVFQFITLYSDGGVFYFFFNFIIFCSDGGIFICFSFYYILLWWWGIYLFFILLDFALMVGYLFVFHFIRFFSDSGVFICFSFY